MHGTTRDTIEERINLRGIALRLFDTAGLRAPENLVEREGIDSHPTQARSSRPAFAHRRCQRVAS